jgi:hypothetical protein
MDRITVECVPSTRFFKGGLLSKRFIKVSVSHMGVSFATLKKESMSRWRPNYWKDGVRGTAFDRAFINKVATPVACTVETVMLPSDADARLKKGSCKIITLPMHRSVDVLVGMARNIPRRLAGPPRKSVGDGLRLVAYASESARILPYETSACRYLNRVPGFTGALAPC